MYWVERRMDEVATVEALQEVGGDGTDDLGEACSPQ
jgi:hypothetical protein